MSIFNIYLMIVIIRLWLQLARADFYNPFSQFTVKVTQPIVGPLRRIIPSIGPVDTATLVFAIFIAFAKVLTYAVISQGSFPPLLTAFVFSLFNLTYQVLWLIFIIIIIRAILSWVSQGNHPVEMVMGQLTEPLLRPLRKVLPAVGGLDLSVLLFLLGLQFIISVFSNTFGPFI
ncbi:MAG: YggT family protein [Alphaproteobacteria bacterium]|jgi:YggT family protein